MDPIKIWFVAWVVFGFACMFLIWLEQREFDRQDRRARRKQLMLEYEWAMADARVKQADLARRDLRGV